MNPLLFTEKITEVRFNEVDSYMIVWNGNYAAYFELGRQEFGKVYDISNQRLLELGFKLPLINIQIQFKKPLKIGNEILIRTTYVPTKLSKLIFNYEIVNLDNQEIACTGSTEQVFLKDEIMQPFLPTFMQEWQQKWLVS